MVRSGMHLNELGSLFYGQAGSKIVERQQILAYRWFVSWRTSLKFAFVLWSFNFIYGRIRNSLLLGERNYK